MWLVSRHGRGWTSVCERCTRVYESLRVVWTAVLAVCVMGCDLSLAGAGVLVPLPARVVRELYEPLHGGSCFGGNMAEIAEMAEKLGRSGYNFFRGPCCRYVFASVFPIPESVPGSGNLSTSLNFDRLMPVCWRRGAVRRVWNGHVGLGRLERAVFLFWTLAPEFVHVSWLSLLSNWLTGFRASIASQGLSCAFRFPASGSHGI